MNEQTHAIGWHVIPLNRGNWTVRQNVYSSDWQTSDHVDVNDPETGINISSLDVQAITHCLENLGIRLLGYVLLRLTEHDRGEFPVNISKGGKKYERLEYMLRVTYLGTSIKFEFLISHCGTIEDNPDWESDAIKIEAPLQLDALSKQVDIEHDLATVNQLDEPNADNNPTSQIQVPEPAPETLLQRKERRPPARTTRSHISTKTKQSGSRRQPLRAKQGSANKVQKIRSVSSGKRKGLRESKTLSSKAKQNIGLSITTLKSYHDLIREGKRAGYDLETGEFEDSE